eukprot:8132860-Pyramimonas_sp.AAC.1
MRRWTWGVRSRASYALRPNQRKNASAYSRKEDSSLNGGRTHSRSGFGSRELKTIVHPRTALSLIVELFWFRGTANGGVN